jgi:nucleotide-binding universal stress UspA family protein
MFERILLATDGSSHAERALECARDLALRDDALVIVVHAFEPVPRYVGEPMWSAVLGDHFNMGREIAKRAVQELEDAGVNVDTEVLQGPPAEAVLRVADTRQVDLIVMGMWP